MTTNREIIKQANIDRNRAYDAMQRIAKTIQRCEARKSGAGPLLGQLQEAIANHSAAYQAAWEAWLDADTRIKEAR